MTRQVIFTPSGRRGSFPDGTTVLDAARSLGVDLDSVCGGRGICGRCQVVVGSKPGVEARPDRLSDPGPTEIDYQGKRPLGEGHRLGCAAQIVDDVVIDVPADSQVHRQVIRKRAGVSALPVDPIVRLHYVEVPQPDLASPTGDLERLIEALAEQWELNGLVVDHAVLPGLQTALRGGEWTVTVAVRDGRDLIAIWPGFRDLAVGVAFDVGSTTIAGHLCDLATGSVLASAGRMNPQIGFGEDLMSRVSYVMMNEDGASRLTAVVRQALDELIGELVGEAGVERSDVLELTLVGNPIMHHLVLGLDPRELGTAPFALVTTSALHTPAGELGLEVHPGARVYTLPCIAGHVGADAAGAVLSEGPHRGDSLQLLVDVGTNAELVLGNKERLLAASSPTGPAFEGAQISSGQRAAPGAIERVRIDRSSLEPRFSVIGQEMWSD
ncbi:MAG: ASKHA domain-containing protein, partial [Actinomycetota bacterium]|nr:ASKHA domain-containing protein [Actinomycetota bacterium]